MRATEMAPMISPQITLIWGETGAFQWWGYSERDRTSRFGVAPRRARMFRAFCYCLLALVRFY